MMIIVRNFIRKIALFSNISYETYFHAVQLIASDEPSLMLGFLAAEGSNQDSCLGKAACHSPKLANEYVKAAKAILKGAEMFESLVVDQLT